MVQVSKKVVGSILTQQVVSVCSPTVSVGSLLRCSDFLRSPTYKDMHARLISNSDGMTVDGSLLAGLQSSSSMSPSVKTMDGWMDGTQKPSSKPHFQAFLGPGMVLFTVI